MQRHEISDTIQALESAWRAIQRVYPDVPAVAIYVASGEGKKYGHFGPGNRWMVRKGDASEGQVSMEPTGLPEVMISGEGLERGGQGTFGTLLHEAVHAANAKMGVKDTSRGGRYHNTRFKQTAERMGMTVVVEGPHGWCRTALTEEAVSQFSDQIGDIDAAISLYMRDFSGVFSKGGAEGGGGEADGEGEAQGGEKGRCRQLKAQCGCQRIIRVSRGTFEVAGISCSSCGSDFELVE